MRLSQRRRSPLSHLNMFELGVWCETKLWSALPALLPWRWWAFYACTCAQGQRHKHTLADAATQFKRILEVESREYCNSVPCRKSDFYLGWRCFGGFQLFFVLHNTVGTDRKPKKEKFVTLAEPEFECQVRFWGQLWRKILESDVHAKGHI